MQFPELAELTIWSVESRYPGNTPDVTEDEARETLGLGESVFNAVSVELQEHLQKGNY